MDGDADADRDLNRRRADDHRLDDALQNFFGDLCGVLGLMKVRQDDRELVAAVARDRIRLPNAALQALRNLEQQRVGDAVSERVVDGLEAIEIDEQNGHVAAGAFRRQQAQFQALDEQTPVRQLRQRVVIGLELDLFLGAFPTLMSTRQAPSPWRSRRWRQRASRRIPSASETPPRSAFRSSFLHATLEHVTQFADLARTRANGSSSR